MRRRRSLTWREPFPGPCPREEGRLWEVRRADEEVRARAVLLEPWPGSLQCAPADLIAVSAAALGCLELLVEVPLAVRAVWLSWVRWPQAQVPLTLVARMDGMEAGEAWGRVEARRPCGDECFTAAGLLHCGSPAASRGTPSLHRRAGGRR